MPAPAASPAAIRNTFPSDIEGAPIQHPNTSTMQPSSLPEDNGLGLYHIRNITKNERVSIEVSAPGWIIVTAISLMRFMGKSTGSAVDVRFLS